MKKISILFILFFGLVLAKAMGQITIAPTMVIIDQQNRFGTFLVLNGSDQPQEVSIEFPFAYPVTNEQGDIQMVYEDSTTAEQYSISNVVRGFPQNFVIQPGQRQVVRLTLRPGNFDDGTYWTRIKTTSNAQSPPVGEETSEEITAQITYKLEQVTTLFYKHGDTSTGIELHNFTHRDTEDAIQFIADVERTGNSPFLGSISLTLTGADGNTVVDRVTSTSIYFDYRQVFEVSKEDLESGTYDVQITFKTERPDVSQQKIVQMEPVSRSITFTKE